MYYVLNLRFWSRRAAMEIKVAFWGWTIILAVLQLFLAGIVSDVALAAATAPEGPEWQLVEMNGIPVSPLAGERKPFLMFDPVKKTVTGFAGCNNFFGGYERDGASLKFGPVGSTRMSCPDLQLSLETEFFKVLEKTCGWQIRDNTLLLLDGSEVLARFTDEGRQEVTGPVWQWVQTLYNDDRKVVPGDPKNYTLQLLEGGLINIKADCNMKGGRYSINGKHLSIEITHSTMAACPDNSLEDEFVRELSGVAIYFLQDSDLYLDLQFDSGTMKFSKQSH
jgi:heat shock protein HslJ